MKYMLHFGPQSLHIEMEGAFTFADTRSFHRMMSAINEKDTRSEVRLNMRSLESIDCTALSLLMMAYDMAKRRHMPLIFEGAKGDVLRKLTEAARFNRFALAA